MNRYDTCISGYHDLDRSSYPGSSTNLHSGVQGFLHQQHHFEKQHAKDWNIVGLQYKRVGARGAMLARVTAARRLEKHGAQLELEAYPVISKKVYAFAGFGFANPMPVFPKYRSSLSMYLSISKGWEAEGGVRYLQFDRNIWIGTAGISKYLGSWLFNAKAYIAPATLDASQSYFFTLRRYLKQPGDYLWLQGGTGLSPDETRNIQLTNALHSRQVSAGMQKTVSTRNMVLLSIGYARNEILKNAWDNQYIGAIGYSRRF
jgi:YaiO family outer membrane protein